MLKAFMVVCFLLSFSLVLSMCYVSNEIDAEEIPVTYICYRDVVEESYDYAEKKEEQLEELETLPVQEIVEKPYEEVDEPAGRWIWARVTAYTAWDPIDANSGYQDGYTSTMVDTCSNNPHDVYGIAADPRAIPYGTAIYVPGYWESLQKNKIMVPTRMTIVDDTGGMLRNSWDNEKIVHLDVRYRTRRAALNWGVRWMRVFIYE